MAGWWKARAPRRLTLRGLVWAGLTVLTGSALGPRSERVVEAADGSSVILGSNSNTASRTTRIVASGGGAAGALRVENTNGSGIVAYGSSSGVGIEGRSTNTTALQGVSQTGVGLLGNSTSNFAVYGSAPNYIAMHGISTTSVGVLGKSSSSAGVSGYSDSNVGVSGNSGQHIGVFGGSQNYVAIWGECVNDLGVYGHSVNSAGIQGISDYNVGVWGQSGPQVGVQGISNTSAGVFGLSESNIGVYGTSNTGQGVAGHSNSYIGTQGISESNVGVLAQTNGSGIGLYGLALNGIGKAAHFDGAVVVNGSFTVVNGPKSAAVPHPDGTSRRLYCMESPEAWFEDFGSGQLIQGVARIHVDPEFAATVHGEYHIFLTPDGDSNGLHIAERTTDSFLVRENRGGRSTLSFGYRLIARRRDVAGPRMERINLDDRVQRSARAGAAAPKAPYRPSPATHRHPPASPPQPRSIPDIGPPELRTPIKTSPTGS